VHKILVLAAVIFSLAASVFGFLNHEKYTQTKASGEQSASAATAKTKENTKLSADLKTANEKIAASNADVEKIAAEAVDLKSQITKATSTLADLQKKLSDSEAVVAQQKTDITAKDTRISELETKATQAAQPTNSPSDDLKKLLEEKDLLTTSLQAKLKDQESHLAALKEREAQRKSKSLRPGLEGRILAVNTSWNFVVLSLGDRNGVVNGAEMLIKRGAQLVGKVRITSVEPSTSIADIVPNSVRGSLAVQPGDSVIYSGPSEDNEPKLP